MNGLMDGILEGNAPFVVSLPLFTVNWLEN